MPEAVRLVIWDLDETFWKGTLTEGGHTYDQTNHDIIIELAKRGIVSAICSKNDLEPVKNILVEKGLWDYIIFPSINWNPKGPRLKAMIDDVQLRPETVLFIDDNPLNLNEALHFVPGLQTADEKFIPEILNSPLFKGKDDSKLSRLAQYKLLETRKADESVAEDNTEFLRSCDIRVTIDYDIEGNLDRAVELINRTNQLNFTKERLPEQPKRAARRLQKLLSRITAQAALIRVTDRYGDYGYCGFYLARTKRGKTWLTHYCFSCRILNMGVENWLYEKLGRPEIKVVGEVLTDLSKPMNVDWITVSNGKSGQERAATATPSSLIVIRGACSTSPLAHYFGMDSHEIAGEFNETRDAIGFRHDHSSMLRYAIEGLSPAQMAVLRPLGFIESDFETKFTDTSREPSLRILSNWVDAQGVMWRHKETGFLVPYRLERKKGQKEFDEDDDDEAEDSGSTVGAQEAEAYLDEHFEYAGELSEAEAARNLDVILDALPIGSPLFVIAAPEVKHSKSGVADPDGNTALNDRAVALNRHVREAAARHPEKSVIPVSIADLSEGKERKNQNHFDRKVYYRLYEHIRERFDAFRAERTTGEASKAANAPDTRAMEKLVAE